MAAFFVAKHNISITRNTWIQGVFHGTLGKNEAMKTNELVIVRHFLDMLENRTEQERLQEPIHGAFLYILERDDLINILLFMYGGEEEVQIAHPQYLKVSNKTLLFEYIRDEFYILQYFNYVIIKKYLP